MMSNTTVCEITNTIVYGGTDTIEYTGQKLFIGPFSGTTLEVRERIHLRHNKEGIRCGSVSICAILYTA